MNSNFELLNNKINEFKSNFEEIVALFPADNSGYKEKIMAVLELGDNKLQSDYKCLLSQNEIDSITNYFNTMNSNLLNYKQTKNTGYLNNMLNQIVSLKSALNAIPMDTFNQMELKRLIADCKKARDINIQALEDLKRKQKVVLDKAEAVNDKSMQLLSDATTGLLSQEFERKRKEEMGGVDKKCFFGLCSRKTWGTYKKDTVAFIVVLVLLAMTLAFGDRVAAHILNIDFKTGDLVVQNITKVLAKLSLSGPLVWLAIVLNKKMNLSKKLAEEYWHKEIVTKTFVGLSDQIDKNTEGETAKDLRIMLLKMTLDTIARNPADCIGGHNDADNPVRSMLKMSKKGLDRADRALDLVGKAKGIID